MKKCTECGFSNKSELKFCQKCGALLPEEDPSQMFSIPGESGQPLPDGLRMTIRGTDRNADFLDEELPASPPPSTQNVFTCPNCWHTPLRTLPTAENPCPNCGYVGSSSGKPKPSITARTRKQTVMMQDLVLEDDTGHFRLINERTKDHVEFQGTEIVLNRGNIDPNNPSISSSQHAKISKEEGIWMLEDLSSNQATFIQVRGKIALQPGDRIILGNKIFRFDTD